MGTLGQAPSCQAADAACPPAWLAPSLSCKHLLALRSGRLHGSGTQPITRGHLHSPAAPHSHAASAVPTSKRSQARAES